MRVADRATLICPVAVAGTGKSTFARRLVAAGVIPRHSVVSLDKLRQMTTGRIDDFSTNGEVISIARTIVSSRLDRGLVTYMDSTHLRSRARRWSASLAVQYDADIVWLDFGVRPEEALRRNESRDLVVPQSVMARQIQTFQQIDWSVLPGRILKVDTDLPELDLTPAA